LDKVQRCKKLAVTGDAEGGDCVEFVKDASY
jgi:hypothetical protein